MAVTQYIGSRYVPLFADPVEWSDQNTYEPLTIVLHEGNSYTSKQAVPKDIAIDNEDFWALTGNYNAQIELYRRETAAAKAAADDAQAAADTAQSDIVTLLPKSAFSAAHTVQNAIDEVQGNVDALLPSSAFSPSNTVKDTIDAVQSAIEEVLPISEYSTESTIADSIKAHTIEAKMFTNYDSMFVGRILTENNVQKSPQGICLISDTVAWVGFAATAAAGTNTCQMFKVDMAEGTVLDKRTAPFAHCNGMTFDSTTDHVFVCPVYNYESASAPYNIVYECDKDTLAIVKVHTFANRCPHSIARDKVTGTFYIAFEVTSPEYAIDVCSVDMATDTIIKDYGILPVRANLTTVKPSVGAQSIGAYDDILFYSAGRAQSNYIMAYDQSLHHLGTINLQRNCYIYEIQELQGIDFTSKGSIVFLAASQSHYVDDIGVVGCIDLTGTFGYADYSVFGRRHQESVHLAWDDETGVNAIFRPNGTTIAPFHVFGEALAACVLGYASYLQFDTDYAGPLPRYVYNVEVTLRLYNHTLHITSAFQFVHCVVWVRDGSVVGPNRMDFDSACVVHFSTVTFDGSQDGSLLPSFAFSATACIVHLIGVTIIDNPAWGATNVRVTNSALFTATNCVNVKPTGNIQFA